MPVAGFVRLRKHQFGRQAAFGTKVAATRAYPFSGTPDVELNWTDPEVDTGSRDITMAPFREAPDLSASLDLPVLTYNDLTVILSAFLGGGETPTGGTAKTWAFAPASLTVDDPDLYTYEFGDDVLTDWYQLGDGLLESFEITGPEGLGPLTASASWRFGSVSSTGSTDSPVTGTVPTAGLTVDTDPTIIYLKDGAIYIADSVAGLAAGQISDALHNFTFRGEQEVDQKRWANGDQSFNTDAYGPGARTFELECTFAKTADTVGTGSESDAWMSDTAVTRFVRMFFESTRDIEYGMPYSWEFILPMRYYTRTEGEVGGNTVITLMGRGFYEPADLSGILTSELVNTLAAL